MRLRAALGAVAVVGAALLLAGLALVLTMRSALVDEVRSTAVLTATALAQELERGRSPSLAVGVPDEQLVQVLDATGRVTASNDAARGRPAVARLPAGESAEVDDVFEEDDAVVVAVAAGSSTVLVALSVEEVVDATDVVTRLLLLGLPVLLVLVAATSWRVTGRALAPVEAIRSEVDAISAGQLHRRVPQPGGGDEVARLATTMNRMLERLEATSRRQQRFVSDASHELRSPIAAIRQHAEVALAHPQRTTTAELAAAVLDEDLRSQRLVEDLLLLARADEDGLARQRRSVDLDDLLLAEARRLRATTSLQVDTTGVSAGRVTGDEPALRRVVRNLVDNAARHATGRLALSVGTSPHGVLLAVEDDGPGIAAQDRQRAQERFVRLDAGRARDDGGAGLGLAIVAEVVAAHDGQVEITAGALGGARVVLRLPTA